MFVSTREYVLTHGKEPRGRGSWAFFFDDETDLDKAYWHNGTFTEALNFAKKFAMSKGYSKIEVGT